ncbi:MAG: glutamate racemase [Patescibacteria group bacterium]
MLSWKAKRRKVGKRIPKSSILNPKSYPVIALFDSGYGGLTVLKSFLKVLPKYDYLYLGDSARVPYGPRSPETIQKFSEEGIQFFIKEKVPLVIVACNTISAVALRYLQKKYSDQIKILGVVRPLAEYAAKNSAKKRIGIAGTRATIASGAYKTEIQKLDPACEVIGQACPLLVPLIEENWHHKPETRMILRKYLRSLKTHNIDTLILGCTHYPMLQKEFQKIMGARVHVPNPGDIVAASFEDYLQRHPEIEKKLTKKGTQKFLTTGDVDRFEEFSTIFLEGTKINVQKIAL